MARSIEAFKQRVEISVDNARANAALATTTHKLETLSGGFKGLLGTFSREAKEGIERVEGLGGAFTSLTGGPLGLAIGGFTALAASITGAGVALFNLADKSAEAGDKIFELSEKSGFSAETISAFKLAAEAGGSTIEEFSSGLSKFNINMAAAAEGDEKLAKAFKRMGVDIKQGLQDPEAALAQFMKRFAELPTNQQRVIAASEIFGKKFGANLVGTFNQAGGNLDEFMKRMRELGIVIDDESAKASNDFEDMKKQFELQFGAMTRTIGFETLPAFMTMFVEIDKGLAGNQANWKKWGQEIAGLLLTVESLVIAFKRTIQSIDWKDLIPAYGFVSLASKFWQQFKGAAQETVDSYNVLAGNAFGGDLSAGFMNRRKGLDLGEDNTGTGPARVGHSAAAALNPLKKLSDILQHVNQQLQGNGEKTEFAKVQQELMAAGLGQLTGKYKEQGEALAKAALSGAAELDVKKQIAALEAENRRSIDEDNRRISEFGERQKEQFESLSAVQLTATDELNRFIASEKAAGFAVDETTKNIWAQRASALDLNQAWESLLATADRLDKEAGDFVRPDKWGSARGAINDAAAAAATKGWKVLPSDETRPKWAEFFQMGLTDALNGINGMFSQQQSKKSGLFSKILGFAAPFLSFIPAVGPLLSMAAGAASSALAGDFGGAASSVAGGFQSGAFKIRRSSSSGTPSHSDAPGHASGLRYVPHDNYYARLHRGERVLTANENRNMTGGSGLSAAVDRMNALLARLESMPAQEVVRMGARGVTDAMSADADLIRLVGNHLRLA